MNLLALDTSSVACSVALLVDDIVFERNEEKPREHTRLLIPMIRELLRESETNLSNLDAIVLGNGPGSFIGIRIAASLAQGLAHAAGIGIIPVSSLAAVAAEVFVESDAATVAVAQDAHMNEVYFGLYRRGEKNFPIPVVKERLQPQAEIPELKIATANNLIAAGGGWQRYPALGARNAKTLVAQSNVLYPRARHVLALAKSNTAISPLQVEPAYLRKNVAQKPAQLTQ